MGSRWLQVVLVEGETCLLQVLLVSDPSTDKAAAAMDVHIGHMSDPPNLPGLAHFCEHMLFLGWIFVIFCLPIKYISHIPIRHKGISG